VDEYKNNKVNFKHLGLIDFKEAWDQQTFIFNKIIETKINNRALSPEEKKITENYILFCEHPHVYTIGKSGVKENLLADAKLLKEKNASFFEINRGGDITYHGPGQIVAYPILDLDNFFTDIHKYMRSLEEAVIRTLQKFNVPSGRVAGLTGVWIDFEDEKKARKICALGVKTSRWVSMHGLALNVNTDLNYFENIIPCGIVDKAVTSMSTELKQIQDMKKVEMELLKNLSEVFAMEIIYA
jgi:lipoyl(octanoyl) transferase